MGNAHLFVTLTAMKTIRKPDGFHYQIFEIPVPAVLDENGVVVTPASMLEIETDIVRGIEIEVTQSATIAAVYPDHVRTIYRLSNIEDCELDIAIHLQFRHYAADGITPLSEIVQQDESLSAEKRAQLLHLVNNRTFDRPNSTKDAWVVPPSAENGGQMQWSVSPQTPGAIPEIAFYQALTDTSLQQMGVPTNTEPRNLRKDYLMQQVMMRSIISRLDL